ncbi:MAG: PHP domain-containing protein [Clostridia bacterium]|nr:PHP domain-containing protein [Clostridia bacterium]
MAAELHCHTKISDGSTNIEDVIAIARRSKISTLAITDHDSFAGTTRAKVLGERFKINVINGIELSAYDYERDSNVHILGYLPLFPNRLEGLCHRTNQKRRECTMEMMKKVMKEFPITADMVAKCASGSTNIFKQHIMHALMLAGCTDSIFGDLYHYLFNKKDGTCYVKIEYPDVFDVLKVLKDSGGIAVLAHPDFYQNMDLLPALIEKGLDGIELWHPTLTPETAEKIRAIADENNLLLTGGTDFHGMYTDKPLKLGSYMTPDENVKALLAKRREIEKNFA